MTLRSRLSPARQAAAASAAALLLAACGGGSPLSNPPDIQNPPGESGQKLSFAYFQRCINPILLAQLTIRQNGQASIATCANNGCHDNSTGTGGALRLIGAAPDIANLTADLSARADEIRAAPIYVSFYSSQASTVIGAPTESRMLNKPMVRGTLHGGGLIFESADDPNAKVFAYWISHPMPVGQDEFGAAAANLFEGGDVANGNCLTQ